MHSSRVSCESRRLLPPPLKPTALHPGAVLQTPQPALPQSFGAPTSPPAPGPLHAPLVTLPTCPFTPSLHSVPKRHLCRVTDSSQLAQDCPGFKSEKALCCEPPQSPANGQLPLQSPSLSLSTTSSCFALPHRTTRSCLCFLFPFSFTRS